MYTVHQRNMLVVVLVVLVLLDTLLLLHIFPFGNSYMDMCIDCQRNIVVVGLDSFVWYISPIGSRYLVLCIVHQRYIVVVPLDILLLRHIFPCCNSDMDMCIVY